MRSDLFGRLLCRYVGDGAERRLKSEHGGGVASLVIADGFEETHVLEAALRPLAVLLQHGEHGIAGLSDFCNARAHHMPGQNGGRSLAKRAGLHLMGKCRNGVAIQLEVHANARPAKFRLTLGITLRIRQNACERQITGKFENLRVIYVVHAAIGPVFPVFGKQSVTSATGFFVFFYMIWNFHARKAKLSATLCKLKWNTLKIV